MIYFTRLPQLRMLLQQRLVILPVISCRQHFIHRPVQLFLGVHLSEHVSGQDSSSRSYELLFV